MRPGTMAFPIGAHAFNSGAGRLLVGTEHDIEGPGSSFSIAMSDHGGPFEPLMPEKVILNNVVDQTNPAYGKAVQLLHAPLRAQSLPVFTLKEDPHTLYMLESILPITAEDTLLQKFHILISKQMRDAYGNIGDIHAIASTQLGEQFLLFVAISPAGQPFGTTGSGIAMLQLINWQTNNIWPTVENNSIVYKEQANVRYVDLVVRRMVKNKAAAKEEETQEKEESESSSSISSSTEADDSMSWVFEGGLQFIMSHNSNSTLRPGIDMYWDPQLNRLFIALQGQSGPNEQDILCALIAGQLKLNAEKKQELTFSPIIPINAITRPDHIVATKGAHQSVSLYKVRTMLTTTGLSYIVVAGGNGEPDEVGNSIYALPLINDNKNNITNGMLADVAQEPYTTFAHNYPFSLANRGFLEIKKEDNQPFSMNLFTHHDKPAMVGNGPLPMASNQRVTDLFTQGDAVYATIGDEQSKTTQPGMFYSQALFDAQGRIVCWTPWKRTAGIARPLSGGAMDMANGNVWLLGGPHKNVVGYTVWSDGSRDYLLGGTEQDAGGGFVSLVSQHFPVANGGVLSLEDFPVNIPVFGADASTALQQLSLQVITGNGVVMLVETSRNEQPFIVTANIGDFADGMQIMSDGTLSHFKQNDVTKIIVLRGGVLDQLGPINCSQISRCPLVDGTARGWLFVGGTSGVAVLSHPDNSGWDTSCNQGLHAGFAGLTSDMSFKMVGDYRFVQKLFCDDTYLYVLTHDRLDRRTLADLNECCTIADATILGFKHARFFDAAISGSHALVATSKGLYASSGDIRATQPTSWRNVELPEGQGAITSLYTVSADEGFAPYSNIYLINKQANSDITRVYRCVVQENDGHITIEPIFNQFIKNVPSYFLQYNSHRNFVGTEGGYFYSSMVDHKKNKKGSDQETTLSCPQILFHLQPGFRFMETMKRAAQTSATESSNARLLKRSSASGALLLVTKEGLTVHE